ncbi:MAG TPA: histidine--tRNA ligase [Bacteroidales bacterium]|nr:histidine--tRNA ligase [Bacteroidales bacterium]HOS57706.1 histidine--tRNA ligase [Bacteroidales bacterium]HRR04183.1 histidine--tRNA ligase [Bacteroidales bacterium]HRT13222.1 histidine--tRNA ligase [Bacteroidales bacterium]HXK73459.1 histidine--tRNA ligase [Bacteroidales bacterium]
MANVKPSIPKGTRDFTPTEMVRRNYILNTIRSIFEKYAYLPIETPSIENLSTLMGKYGEEGDRLIFKILNSGDFLANVDLGNKTAQQLTPLICEKGLRYDLTVPFARFIVQHQNELIFPFKRYQMQPVWRADRPQKGRYREFYQCDIDVIGSNSMLNEAELINITDEVFNAFKLDTVIKVNNRKILSGIAEIISEPDKITTICTAIDKLDKIGREGVLNELKDNGLTDSSINKLMPFFDFSGTNEQKLDFLEKMFINSEIGRKGIDELRSMLSYVDALTISTPVEIEFTLARGLNYYTGAIFEVKCKQVAMGSVAGGGRYDDLTSIFGLKNMSGVGISYGAERIYDILLECDGFPTSLTTPIKVLFINFGKKEELYALQAVQQLRNANITCELYPDNVKIGKQLNYANNKAIPFVIMAGENEIKENCFTLKNMQTGEQKKVTITQLLEYKL